MRRAGMALLLLVCGLSGALVGVVVAGATPPSLMPTDTTPTDTTPTDTTPTDTTPTDTTPTDTTPTDTTPTDTTPTDTTPTDTTPTDTTPTDTTPTQTTPTDTTPTQTTPTVAQPPPPPATGPSLQVPGRLVAEATSAQGAVVHFSVSASDDEGAVLPEAISCTHTSGQVFRLGKTTVTCRVGDAAGNEDTKSFEVVVQDTTAPLPQPPGDLVVVATSSRGIESTHRAIAAFAGRARARDLVDASPQAKAELPTQIPLGATPVRFVFIDSAGNQAVAHATVTVVESGPGRTPGEVISMGSDRAGPPDPRNVKAKPGPASALLVWENPRDENFDHVDIYRTEVTEATRTTQASANVLVYRGKGTSFKDRRVKGGVHYRYSIVSFDREGDRSLGAIIDIVTRLSFLVAPREGALLSRPPTLQWKRKAGATYYNVQVFRGKTKILSAWPTGTSLKLSSGWRYGGRSHRLVRGVYRWYLWPGIGKRSQARYGPLMGERTFTISAAVSATTRTP